MSPVSGDACIAERLFSLPSFKCPLEVFPIMSENLPGTTGVHRTSLMSKGDCHWKASCPGSATSTFLCICSCGDTCSTHSPGAALSTAGQRVLKSQWQHTALGDQVKGHLRLHLGPDKHNALASSYLPEHTKCSLLSWLSLLWMLGLFQS